MHGCDYLVFFQKTPVLLLVVGEHALNIGAGLERSPGLGIGDIARAGIDATFEQAGDRRPSRTFGVIDAHRLVIDLEASWRSQEPGQAREVDAPEMLQEASGVGADGAGVANA